MGDRSGGREPKGSSLKKSKKNPGAPAAKTKKAPKLQAAGPSTSLPPPPPSGEELYFDCGAAILSRQFDRDRERMLIRAKTEGNCCGVVSWFSDIEKQLPLAEFCKVNTGYCYFVTGVHPDNIDGTNKKAHDVWLEKTEELAKRAECVGILSGFNLSREMKTHFAQEALLKSSCELAEKLQLPVVLHVPDSTSLEKALDILREIGWTADSQCEDEYDEASRRVIIHDIITACGGNLDKMHLALSAGCHIMVSAAGLTDPDASIQQRSAACIRAIPLEKILVCSDAPWKTPQNLPDLYLRTLRNEPANIPYVVQAIASVIDETASASQLALTIRSNSFKIFGMEYLDIDEKNVDVKLPEGHIEDSEHAKKDKPSIKSKQSKSQRDLDLLKNLEDLVLDETNKPEPEKPVHTKQSEKASPEGSYYGCVKCRLRLFQLTDVKVHGIDATRTVFKTGGEQGLCNTTIFIGCVDSKEIASRTGISVRGGNAECSECGAKLGKYSGGEAFCACGVAVEGPSVRVQSVKVDFFDETLNTEELIVRSRIEAEEAQRDALYEEEEDRNRTDKKSKRKKKFRTDNKRSNFSEYRNKNFGSSAPRSKKDKDADENEGNTRAVEEREDDDDDNDEVEENESQVTTSKIVPKQVDEDSDSGDDTDE